MTLTRKVKVEVFFVAADLSLIRAQLTALVCASASHAILSSGCLAWKGWSVLISEEGVAVTLGSLVLGTTWYANVGWIHSVPTCTVAPVASAHVRPPSLPVSSTLDWETAPSLNGGAQRGPSGGDSERQPCGGAGEGFRGTGLVSAVRGSERELLVSGGADFGGSARGADLHPRASREVAGAADLRPGASREVAGAADLRPGASREVAGAADPRPRLPGEVAKAVRDGGSSVFELREPFSTGQRDGCSHPEPRGDREGGDSGATRLSYGSSDSTYPSEGTSCATNSSSKGGASQRRPRRRGAQVRSSFSSQRASFLGE